MNFENFVPPLCLNCEVPLAEKIEFSQEDGLFYQVNYCPNCLEVYNHVICEKK